MMHALYSQNSNYQLTETIIKIIGTQIFYGKHRITSPDHFTVLPPQPLTRLPIHDANTKGSKMTVMSVKTPKKVAFVIYI